MLNYLPQIIFTILFIFVISYIIIVFLLRYYYKLLIKISKKKYPELYRKLGSKQMITFFGFKIWAYWLMTRYNGFSFNKRRFNKVFNRVFVFDEVLRTKDKTLITLTNRIRMLYRLGIPIIIIYAVLFLIVFLSILILSFNIPLASIITILFN